MEMKRTLILVAVAAFLYGCGRPVAEEAYKPSPKAPEAEKQSTVNAGGDAVPPANLSTGDGSEGIRSVSPSTPGDR